MLLKYEAQLEASNIAAWLTGLLLNEVARSYIHNLCVIFVVVLTFMLYIVIGEFLEISYHVPTMTRNVMEPYEGKYQSNILLYEFVHISKKDGMCVLKVSFSQLDCFRGLMVEYNTKDFDNRMRYKMPIILLKVATTWNLLHHTEIYSIRLLASIDV